MKEVRAGSWGFDERIVNQYALFSLTSSSTRALDAWLAAYEELVRPSACSSRGSTASPAG